MGGWRPTAVVGSYDGGETVKSILYVVPLAGVMAACATPPDAVKAVADAQAAMAAVRTIEAQCDGPCRISYTDPRDRQTIRMPTNGWDATIAVAGATERIVTGAYTPAAAVLIAQELRKAGAGGDTSNSTNVSTSSVSTASGAGASTGGAGHYEQVGPDSQNTTTGDTNTTTTTTATDDHSVTSTATPTVVNQPTPVIVRPEIVSPIIHEVTP